MKITGSVNETLGYLIKLGIPQVPLIQTQLRLFDIADFCEKIQ